MKVSKKLLKQIVKECLIEILTEGLGSSVPMSPAIHPSTVPGMNRDMSMAGHMMERYVPPVPADYVAPLPRPVQHNRLNQQVASAVKELAAVTRDPMMASIFEDTARNTLMEQGINDKPIQTVDPRADRAAKIVDAVPPEQLFGDEAASKWAALAFMPGTKKV